MKTNKIPKQTTKQSHSKKSAIKNKLFSKQAVLVIFVILFALVGSILFVFSRAAGTATLTLSPASSTVNLGSTFVVTVQENSGTEAVNTVQADLTYDQSKLQCTGVSTSTSAFSDIKVKADCSNGVINIALGSSTTKTGLQTVATITFNTVGVGTTPVNFSSTSAIVRPSDYSNVLGTSTGGNYTIADKTPPSTPTNLTATAVTSSSVKLNWSASSDNIGVTGYNIYRNGTKINTSATNSFTDTGLSVGVSYTYTIDAYDAGGNISAKSTATSITLADTTAPSVPTSVILKTKTSSSIGIGWTASSDNVAVTGYKIYRGGTLVGSSASTSFTDNNLTPNTSYIYTVAAYDAAGNTSAQSISATFKTDYKNGDINVDGAVNIYDLSILALNYEKSGMTRAQGDLTGDGTVNIYDLSMLASYWGT
jgi:chitodextrinase